MIHQQCILSSLPQDREEHLEWRLGTITINLRQESSSHLIPRREGPRRKSHQALDHPPGFTKSCVHLPTFCRGASEPKLDSGASGIRLRSETTSSLGNDKLSSARELVPRSTDQPNFAMTSTSHDRRQRTIFQRHGSYWRSKESSERLCKVDVCRDFGASYFHEASNGCMA